MPKIEIDYSNTIIYKITCKDTNITDVYVGHTTNFVQRKHAHKQSCVNMKSHNYKCKVYETIRNNGGWNNWKMEIINFFNCRDHYEARQKEQEYFVLLNATLNSIEPMPKPKFKAVKVIENNVKNVFYCEKCNIHCGTEKIFEIHNNTKKHIAMISNNIKQTLSNKYYCENCDYSTSRKSNIDNHFNSIKHKSMISMLNSNGSKQILSNKYSCKNCDKEYKDSSGLWRHKKKCLEKEEIEIEEIKEKDDSVDKELIMMLVKQNSELLDVIKNGTHNTNNSHNNTNNSHNKSFNLQFFLNETCKDAMNIMDFVDSIKLQLSDLENVGKVGYVEGISNIITSNLKALDVSQRPIHCADKKREVLYVRDEDKWEKEDDTKKKIRKAIKRVMTKNQRLIPKFKEAHPDCLKSASKFSDQYNNIIVESMGGSGDNDIEKEDKIIRNISKVTTIS